MGHPLASRRYGLYLFHFKDPDEPSLLADADTLAEAFDWLQHNYVKLVRHGQTPGTFVELLDWRTGHTVHWTRVG